MIAQSDGIADINNINAINNSAWHIISNMPFMEIVPQKCLWKQIGYYDIVRQVVAEKVR